MPDEQEADTLSIGVEALRDLLAKLETFEKEGDVEVLEVVAGFRLLRDGVEVPYFFTSPGSPLVLSGLARWIERSAEARMGFAGSVPSPAPENLNGATDAAAGAGE